MNFKVFAAVAALVLVTACAEQSAMRLAQDTVRIHTSTAPIYGALEAQKRAMRMAAEETLKNGYDKFLIVNGANTYKPNVIGQTAGVYQSSGSAIVAGNASGYSGSAMSQSSYVGPQPVAMPRFESEIIVKMFKQDDPAGANAIDAREIVAQHAKTN